MSEKYKPSNGESYHDPIMSDKGSPGCYVSLIHGFILVLLVMLIAVGVGVVVFFAGGREVLCKCEGTNETPSITPEALKQMCMDVITKGDGEEICDVCPSNPDVTSTVQTTSSPTTPAPTEPPRDYRLPITVVPYLYAIELQPNIYGVDSSAFDFNGSVRISTFATTKANTIVLHAHPTLNITESSVRVTNLNTSSSVTVDHKMYESLRHFYTIHLTTDLVEGVHYSVEMDFRGPLTKSGSGLYLSDYEVNQTRVYLATTQFQAPHARMAFPCFDEPGLKARFDISLIRQEAGERNYTSLSNTPRADSHSVGHGMVKDVYERTVVMSTYLLAFIVCDYEYVEDIVTGNVSYRTWAWSESIQYTETAQRHGVKIFDKFASYFTPAYVYKKLDNIAIPDFSAGAMENWGLITYRDTLLYQPGVSASSNEDWIAEVISHEIAHMWFGNLVSPKWWNWLWLNEAFASFWDYHIVGEIYPDWRKLDMTVVQGVQSVMSTDSLRSSHPMTADVMSPSEISSIFDSITYTKGSAVIKMMHLAMGQDIFIKGLNRYLATHQFGNTDQHDLWNALTEEANSNSLSLNMTELMDPWVTQMNYPVVIVNIDRNNGKITLTQQRFLVSESENATQDIGAYGFRWSIPITYTTSDSPNFTTEHIYSSVHHMMYHESSIDLNVMVPADGWVMLNLQEYGFYRVQYDEQNWENIINFLTNGTETLIHPINRAQIINDAWNLAKADMLPQRIALSSIRFLSKDLDYAPWRAFTRELGYVEDMLQYTQLFGKFEEFIRNSVATPFSVLKTNITENMPPIDKMQVSQIVSLACKYDYQECVVSALADFNSWQSSSNNSIHPDLRYTYYCTAVRHGGAAEWNFVYNQYHLTTSTSEKNRLRQALACTRETWLLKRLLDMSLDSDEIRAQDTRTTVTYVGESRWGKELTWNFVTHNFDKLAELLQSFSGMSRLVLAITARFNTQQEYKMVEDFMNSRDVSAAGTGFSQILERTKTNIDWMEDNYEIFSDWLEQETREI